MLVPEGQTRHAALKGLGWFVVLALVAVAAMNLSDLSGSKPAQQGASGTPTSPPAQPAGEPREITIAIPRDTGSPRAKVVFEVFLPRRGACECHVEAALLGRAVAAVSSEHLRVVFGDLALPETQARTKKLGAAAPCAGFAINGRSRFIVPSTLPKGPRTRTVDFLSYDRNWTMPDVYAALNQEYEKAYEAKLPVTGDAFQAAVSAEMKKRSEVVVGE